MTWVNTLLGCATVAIAIWIRIEQSKTEKWLKKSEVKERYREKMIEKEMKLYEDLFRGFGTAVMKTSENLRIGETETLNVADSKLIWDYFHKVFTHPLLFYSDDAILKWVSGTISYYAKTFQQNQEVPAEKLMEQYLELGGKIRETLGYERMGLTREFFEKLWQMPE